MTMMMYKSNKSDIDDNDYDSVYDDDI
jgi:hypothetical protein